MKIPLHSLRFRLMLLLETGNRSLSTLGRKRSGVDALDLSGAESFAFYTARIDQLLGVIAGIARLSNQAAVIRTLTTYTRFRVREVQTTGVD